MTLIKNFNYIYSELMRFCFLPMVQNDLDMVRRTWNNHRIRKIKNVDAPSGKPDMLFYMPELTGQLVSIFERYIYGSFEVFHIIIFALLQSS